jgi:hypothetical protein
MSINIWRWPVTGWRPAHEYQANLTRFQERDQIWLYYLTQTTWKTSKLQPTWKGPYKVVNQINVVVYRIQWRSWWCTCIEWHCIWGYAEWEALRKEQCHCRWISSEEVTRTMCASWNTNTTLHQTIPRCNDSTVCIGTWTFFKFNTYSIKP